MIELTYRLSIALVTRNRPESLRRTLQSLSLQKNQPFEVLISDDSDIEECKVENMIVAEQFGCLYYEGPKKGLYANRNFVATKCSGTHIRTMDDDHEFPVGHFEECMNAINSNPEAIWTIGEYYVDEPCRYLPPRVPGQLHPRGYSYQPNDLKNYYGISCGGTIYPRTIVDMNLLNCDIYPFGIMYLEYGARLKKLGYNIQFLTSTYIIHNDTITSAAEINKTVIYQARIFSMLCLSFYHQPSSKNKFETLVQLISEFARFKYSYRTFFKAYNKFKSFVAFSN